MRLKTKALQIANGFGCFGYNEFFSRAFEAQKCRILAVEKSSKPGKPAKKTAGQFEPFVDH